MSDNFVCNVKRHFRALLLSSPAPWCWRRRCSGRATVRARAKCLLGTSAQIHRDRIVVRGHLALGTTGAALITHHQRLGCKAQRVQQQSTSQAAPLLQVVYLASLQCFIHRLYAETCAHCFIARHTAQVAAVFGAVRTTLDTREPATQLSAPRDRCVLDDAAPRRRIGGL